MGALQPWTSAIGETGNDFAKGAIANTEQSHQFLMDYLANQARSRGLDLQQSQQGIEKTGQQQQFDLANKTLAQNMQIHKDTLLANGYKDFGVQYKYGPKGEITGAERLLYNDVDGSQKRIPVDPGNLPESQYGMYQTMIGMKDENGQPLFFPDEAKELIWPSKPGSGEANANALYSYDDYAKRKYPNDPVAAQKLSNQLRNEEILKRWSLPFGGSFNAGINGTGDMAHIIEQLQDPNSPLTIKDLPMQVRTMLATLGVNIPNKLADKTDIDTEYKAKIAAAQKLTPTIGETISNITDGKGANKRRDDAIAAANQWHEQALEALRNKENASAPAAGAAGGAAFTVPPGAPSAQGVPDGHQLKMNGKVVAVAKGGQWVAP